MKKFISDHKPSTPGRRSTRISMTAFLALSMLVLGQGSVGTAQQLPPSPPKLPEYDAVFPIDDDAPISGDWTADSVADPSPAVKIHIRRLAPRNGGQGTMNTLPVPGTEGLSPDILTAARSNVQFSITREAGTIRFEGTFAKGRGSGTWTLSPDSNYISAMARRGYTNLKGAQLFFAVTEDITEKYIDDLKTAGFDGLSFIELVEAAGNNVTPDFIQRVRSRGYPNATLKEIVQLRVHDIIR